MMMEEVIKEIKRFIENHEKTDPPLFVYYEPIKNYEKSKNTGFLTTMDESVSIRSNSPYVTFYGGEYESDLNIKVWLRGIVPLSEIDNI